MLNLPGKILAFLACVVISAAAGGWGVARYKNNQWAAEVARIQNEASAQLQEANAKLIAAERASHELSTTLEVKNGQTKKELDRALADNRRLMRERGGMRDPAATNRPRLDCRVPPAGSAAVPPASAAAADVPDGTEGLLSAETSEWLMVYARRADEAAAYAATCYAWISEITKPKAP